MLLIDSPLTSGSLLFCCGTIGVDAIPVCIDASGTTVVVTVGSVDGMFARGEKDCGIVVVEVLNPPGSPANIPPKLWPLGVTEADKIS